jgi:hypothetical protein
MAELWLLARQEPQTEAQAVEVVLAAVRVMLLPVLAVQV